MSRSRFLNEEHEEIRWVKKEELGNYKISKKEKETMLIGLHNFKGI